MPRIDIGRKGDGAIARRWLAWFRAAALWAMLALLFALPSSGQVLGMKNFKIADPYPAPYEKQTKSQLEGGQAVPVRGGYWLSQGVTLRTFSESNTLQLTVRAQECFYNSSNRMVNSAGPLQMQTADGKFSIEGVGFYWEQTNSSLFISNQVHTLIQAELFQDGTTSPKETAANSNTGPLSILSDQFSYHGTNGLGIWRRHVSVTGTNLALQSAQLTAKVPMDQRRVLSLLAETNVLIDYHGLQGTGARLTYAPDSGLIRLRDHATWKDDKRQGRGDELIIDRSNQVFQVNGHAELNLPGQSLGEAGLLSLSNAPPPPTPSTVARSIDITCRRYEIRTNLAVFNDRVRLEEHWNGTVRSRMSCQRQMTASFTGTNQLENIVADQNVVIEEGLDRRFTGGHACYTHTNTTLELTQDPKWQDGSRQGKGDVVRLNTQQRELTVNGNAWMRLPASQLASELFPTNQAAVQRPRKPTGEVADIYCQRYTLSPEKSLFRGGVYVTHPEMNESCEQMTVETPSGGLTNVLSEGNVVFDLLTQNGKMHGAADAALYSFGQLTTLTNGSQAINQLKLTGTPATITNFTRGIGMQDTVLIWDRGQNKIVGAGGNYRMQGSAPAVNTNIFLLPNRKRGK